MSEPTIRTIPLPSERTCAESARIEKQAFWNEMRCLAYAFGGAVVLAGLMLVMVWFCMVPGAWHDPQIIFVKGIIGGISFGWVFGVIFGWREGVR